MTRLFILAAVSLSFTLAACGNIFSGGDRVDIDKRVFAKDASAEEVRQLTLKAIKGKWTTEGERKYGENSHTYMNITFNENGFHQSSSCWPSKYLNEDKEFGAPGKLLLNISQERYVDTGERYVCLSVARYCNYRIHDNGDFLIMVPTSSGRPAFEKMKLGHPSVCE